MNLLAFHQVNSAYDGAQSCTLNTGYDYSGNISGTVIESFGSLVQCDGSNNAIVEGYIFFEDETCTDAVTEFLDNLGGSGTEIQCVESSAVVEYVLVPTATSSTTIVWPQADWMMLTFFGWIVLVGVLGFFKR